MSTPTAAPLHGNSFRLALIQLGGTGPTKQFNLQLARDKIKQAAKGEREGDPTTTTTTTSKGKVDLVVLPEIFNSPYSTSSFRQYAERIPFTPGRVTPAVELEGSESLVMLSQAAKEEGVWLVGGSIPELGEDDKIYNSSPTFNRQGELVALHRKIHLFDIDIPGGITFKESDTLTGGDRLTLIETEFGKIAVGICYDVRFPEMAQIAARAGAIAMIYPAAFNTTTGPLHWDLLQRARAIDNQFYIIMCSPARATEGEGYKAWGYSGVVDPSGKIVNQLEEKEGILFGEVDVDAVIKARAGIPVTVQRRFDVYSATEEVGKK